MRSVEAAGTRDTKPRGSVAFRKQSVRVTPTEVDRRSSAATNKNEEEYKRRSTKTDFANERRQTSMKFNLKGGQPSWVADMQGPDGKIMYAFQFFDHFKNMARCYDIGTS